VESQKQVSHETIYRSLFIQARGVLKKELLEHLSKAHGPLIPARQHEAGTGLARSRTPYPSVNDHRRLKMAQYPAIGKAI
jgi:hypothetical protein